MTWWANSPRSEVKSLDFDRLTLHREKKPRLEKEAAPVSVAVQEGGSAPSGTQAAVGTGTEVCRVLEEFHTHCHASNESNDWWEGLSASEAFHVQGRPVLCLAKFSKFEVHFHLQHSSKFSKRVLTRICSVVANSIDNCWRSAP